MRGDTTHTEWISQYPTQTAFIIRHKAFFDRTPLPKEPNPEWNQIISQLPELGKSTGNE